MTETITSIPVEEVARLPLPGMAVPSAVAFSPDDRLITYLRSGNYSLESQLYVFEIETGQERLLVSTPETGAGEEGLTPEERLRRERKRQLITGLTGYAWAVKGQRMLVPLGGDLYVLDDPKSAPRRLLESRGTPILDPQLSPDGAWVAYVQGGELYVLSAEQPDVEPLRLTHTARPTLTNGLAEFVAQEEMDRSHGFWWSPDGAWLAFEEADASPIPVYRIIHQGEEGETPLQEEERYPFAGEANAGVRLGVVARGGGEPVWMDLGEMMEDGYLARVDWLPDGRLTAQIENRAQDRLELAVFDPRSGARQTLLVETSPAWINLNDLFWPLKSGGFIWGSERSGYRHLYLYDQQGQLVRPLTAGEWMVDALCGVDEPSGWAYFTANRENPTENRLYAAALSGGEPRCITPEAGMHSVVIDGANRRFVDTYQSTTQPAVVRLRSLADGQALATLFENADPRLAELKLAAPEIVTITNRGRDKLYGAIFRPPASFGPGPYPTIVYVYGGPHVQLVKNSWDLTAALRAQSLARLGYLVFALDNRGSARRGLAFESAIRHQIGQAEIADQVDGVRWLVAQGLADPQRVGIYGWSYGGFMAVSCLLREPETFKVAVSGAPVTFEEGYDTHYTERYMGTPQGNPDGYAASRVSRYVEGLSGKLLLIHGLIDENVHFRHTARLIDALNQARKPYELLLLPNARHSVRRDTDRVYLEERIRDFFIKNL